jgi:replicative DNA helicase
MVEKLSKHIISQMIDGLDLDLKQEELMYFSDEFKKQYTLLKQMNSQKIPISKTDLEIYSIYKEQNIDIDYAESNEELKKVPIMDQIKLSISVYQNEARVNRMKYLLEDYSSGSSNSGKELYRLLSENLNNSKEQNILNISNYYEEQKTFFNNMVAGNELEGLVFYGNNKKNTRQFMSLSNILKRIALTDFVVIGARPSVGKTSFSLAMMNALYKNGYKPMFISLEMTNGELLQRLATAKSGLSYDLLMSPETQISSEQEHLYLSSLKEASEMKIKVMDNPPTSWLEMKREMLKVVDEVDYYIIDHMHIISTYDGTTNGNKNDMYGEISRDMKLFARDYKKPIILLVQLNREVKSGTGKGGRVDPSYVEPFMSDIRASGNIEQDADKILMLYRKTQSTSDKSAQKTSAESQKKYGRYLITCKVEKNRAGSLGEVNYMFQAKNGRWEELYNKKEREE